MTKYFFDIHDGIDVRDDEGVELSGIDAARAQAIGKASEYVSKLDGGGRGGYIVVTIRDAMTTVLAVRLVCQIDTSGISADAYIDEVRRKVGA